MRRLHRIVLQGAASALLVIACFFLMGPNAAAEKDPQKTKHQRTLKRIDRNIEVAKHTYFTPPARELILQRWQRARTGLLMTKRGQDVFPWLFGARILEVDDQEGVLYLDIMWLSNGKEVPEFKVIDKSGQVFVHLSDKPSLYWTKYVLKDGFYDFKRAIALRVVKPGEEVREKPVIRVKDREKLTGILMHARGRSQYVPIIDETELPLMPEDDRKDIEDAPSP
jgi:hypothetical protein